MTGTPGKNSPVLSQFSGLGYSISFQDGPIKDFGYNGTTNEELLEILIARVESLNTIYDGKFHCAQNDLALSYLHAALMALVTRTADRLARGVEGTSLP